MNGKPDLPAVMPSLQVWTILSGLAVWIVIALAAQVVGWISSSWVLLPPLAVLGIGLPIYLIVRAGTGGLSLGSRRRAWTVFGLGLTAGPVLASVVEVAAYLAVLLAGSIALALNPEWQAAFTQVTAQLENAVTLDQILTVAAPYLMNPVAIILMLLVVSVFIPLTEELVKPVGIWLLRKRPPTPQEGFALGVISGAGFALFESLIAMASSDGDWGVAFLARVGGGVIHSLNTGLMGWAIASYWKERRFGRLARTYGLVVLLHGLWNAMTVLTVVGGLRVLTSPSQVDLLGSGMMMASIAALGILAIGGLIALVVFNLRMRPAPVAEAQELKPVG
jgi:RsiW-degrading membrane proteinase PrsW (M82 family)